jgi:hypothetical protein
MIGHLLTLLLLLPFGVSAADALNDLVAGQKLAIELRNSPPENDARLEGVMKLYGRDGRMMTTPLISSLKRGFQSWDAVYSAGDSNATEVLKVIHTQGRTNEYHHQRTEGAGAPQVTPPPATNIWTPFARSDFLVADLGLDFLHWPVQILVENEMRKNRACHVLESRPAVTNTYCRVRSWLDVETGGLLLAEAYDARNRRSKVFEVRRFQKTGDTWQLHEIEMRNLADRTRTVLQFDAPGK